MAFLLHLTQQLEHVLKLFFNFLSKADYFSCFYSLKDTVKNKDFHSDFKYLKKYFCLPT